MLLRASEMMVVEAKKFNKQTEIHACSAKILLHFYIIMKLEFQCSQIIIEQILFPNYSRSSAVVIVPHYRKTRGPWATKLTLADVPCIKQTNRSKIKKPSL